ncbi:hypothetical protein JYK22_17805, partial [Nonomuraea sp. RK-328]|nr:hypothetical protein [Nonomuraea sp. RK-328]
VTGPLSETEDSQGFYAWLLAARPAGLSTTALGDPVWRIGCTTPTGIALVSSDDARNAIHAGGTEALVTLSGWAESWRSCGSPGLDCLRADLVRQEDGWLIRLTL